MKFLVGCQKKEEPFDNPEWSFEWKYDGFRGVLYVKENRCIFASREGRIFSEPIFKRLGNEIRQELKMTTAIFDGEIVVKDESNRPIFNDLIKRTGGLSYIAFDLLWLDGEDLRDKSLSERRKRLWKVIPKNSSHITPALFLDKKGKRLFELMCIHDLEGVVAKKLSESYKKSTRWYKIKNKNYSQNKGRIVFRKKK